MNTSPRSRSTPADAPASAKPEPKRRQLVVGAGVAAGAALATATIMRRGEAPAAVAQTAAEAPSADGYRLSDHVLRYYETTRT